MRNLKIMGLAIVAVLAFSAVAASAASALEYKSNSGSGTTFYTGENEGSHVFKAGATVTCTKAFGEGSFTGTAAKTLEPTKIEYSGCTVAGQAATVSMNGCTYNFGQPTGSSPFTISPIKVVCPAGKEIVITATTAGCTIKVGSQTPTSASTATNTGTAPTKTVTLAASVSGIAYTGSGGICGGSGTTGTYSGKLVTKAFSNAAHTAQVNAEIA